MTSVDKNDLIVGPYTYELVGDFKYLGVNINYKNDMHYEVKLKINSTNRAIILTKYII